ncbi:dienelactone hydrolase family protein [Metabacillus sp. B2-18]|uniref:dienelactone hydrolase family protein n=1 Tax=Metabacillus sp. B2-18 TaxID=2897333 RepID=UPI001E2BE21A|nr:dienelactone hydrolase family protein [Metabacillus sp. B2-18]UGB28696.1 dienelactone hydrolase family protein [Metabacillus sp. B2-18]
MIVKHKNSKTVIIVIHEIYGINDHIKGVCESLFQYGYHVICPNLIEQEEPFTYLEEDIAYRHYINKIGFDKATEIINSLILEVKNSYSKVFIVGFSVGATIAWLCSNHESINGVVGYYGSRIRDYLDLVPTCPTILFFPQEEKSFDVDSLIRKLDEKSINTYKFNGLHGFCDPFSVNYHLESSRKAYSIMNEFLKNH